MMFKKIFFLPLIMVISMVLTAQDVEELFTDNVEVYFSFTVNDLDRINEISRIISIDNVTEDFKVYAYANKSGFTEFIAEGIDYEILQHPGTLIRPRMLDKVNIREIEAWDFYPNYDAYLDMIFQLETDFPDLCEVFSIGSTYEEREIYVIRITDNIGQREEEPEFLYSSSIHGDETTGYVLLLRLADYLLNGYGEDPRITDIVNDMDIYLCPLANPDGSFHGGNASIYGAQRFNAHGVDLNRNYPDPQDGPHPDGNPWQIETIHFMNFAEEHNFIMGANFHGGAEVLNYPWDTWSQLAADDDWWVHVCREYADTVHAHAVPGYLTSYNNGITNGYQWYSIAGGRQDYMNYFQQDREITLEISDVKLLPASQLEAHWEYNYRSLINYLDQARYGTRGRITDSATGETLEAEVYVLNHEMDSSWVYSDLPAGNYHRLLNKGTYDIRYSKSGYITQTFTDVVVNNKQATVIDVELVTSFSSIDEQEEGKFSIYPNPATANFIKVKSQNPISQISIFSMNGHLVQQTKTENTELHFVDISDLEAGTYIIRIVQEAGISQQKFVKL
jgi:hypothetical protein